MENFPAVVLSRDIPCGSLPTEQMLRPSVPRGRNFRRKTEPCECSIVTVGFHLRTCLCERAGEGGQAPSGLPSVMSASEAPQVSSLSGKVSCLSGERLLSGAGFSIGRPRGVHDSLASLDCSRRTAFDWVLARGIARERDEGRCGDHDGFERVGRLGEQPRNVVG
jgi:hypothetical protein